MVSCVGPDGGCWILGRCGVVGVSWRCGGDFLRRAARRKISVAQHCETPPGLGTKKEKKKEENVEGRRRSAILVVLPDDRRVSYIFTKINLKTYFIFTSRFQEKKFRRFC